MDLIDTDIRERIRPAPPGPAAPPSPGLAALAAENLRLRGAAAQMQAEIAKLNTLLEPLHALTEQLDHQRRRFEEAQETLRTDIHHQDAKRQADWQRREGEMLSALYRRDKELQVALQRRTQAEAESSAQERAGWAVERERVAAEREHWAQQNHHYATLVAELERRLLDVYASTSWRLTRPVRVAGRLLKGLRG